MSDLPGLGEGDRQRTRAVARDMAGMIGLSEKAAPRALWLAGVGGFIESHIDPPLADGIEDLLLNTSGRKSILANSDRILRRS